MDDRFFDKKGNENSKALVKRLVREGKERVDEDFGRKLSAEYVENKKLFWVEIENEAGDVKKFRIVGPEEIYGDAKDYISIDSPMARALLKKEVDDEVTVRTPGGNKIWFINSINYKSQV